MTLHFDFKQVQALMQHSLAAPNHKALAFDPSSNRPGLVLSGDEGVYLVSNGRPPLYLDPDDPAGPTHRCAYAVECDPSKDLENCRRNKEEAFGGSDGSEFIPYESEEGPCIKHWLEANEGNAVLAMELTETDLELVGSELLPVKAGAVQVLAGDEFQPAFAEGIRWRAWDVAVVEMDRRGLIAYIGALKLKMAELTSRADLAVETNKALTALLQKQKSDNGKRNSTTPATTSKSAPASRRGNRRPKPPETPVDPARKSRAQRAVSGSIPRSAGV